MAKLTQAEVRANAKASAARREEASRNAGMRLMIRQELKGRSDPGVGTSPNSMGAVKSASEEARLATCPDCGYSGGRHSRMCARA